MGNSGWLVMVSAAMSVEDQNRNLLVRDKEGWEEEEEEGEGRSLSWLLLRRKENRFWEEGAEIEKKKIKKMIKQYAVKGKKIQKELVKRLLVIVWLAYF